MNNLKLYSNLCEVHNMSDLGPWALLSEKQVTATHVAIDFLQSFLAIRILAMANSQDASLSLNLI